MITKEEAYKIGCKDSFAEVLHNSDDQVTVRTLLMSIVPIDIQIKIVKNYNAATIERHNRSLKP